MISINKNKLRDLYFKDINQEVLYELIKYLNFMN